MNAEENPLIAIKDAGFGHTPLTVEQAIALIDWVVNQLAEKLSLPQNEQAEEWGSATQIGKIYGWSCDTAIRHLSEGEALGRVRVLKCNGDRGSAMRPLYNLSDVRSYMEWKGGAE